MMYKIVFLSAVVASLGLGGCATSALTDALPDETIKTETTILKTDQIIALGQAIQDQKNQGLVFIGQDYNYLMTDGSAALLRLIKAIPAEQRSVSSPAPLVLTMDSPSHFYGVLRLRYHTRIIDLTQAQKELLKSVGFKQSFDLLQSQQSTSYPTMKIYFEGQLYQGQGTQHIQQKLAQPLPIVLQQETKITTKHPVKRVTRMVLFPLAAAFDVVTVGPLLIWSDLRGDFK